jgi:hypothetical protein
MHAWCHPRGAPALITGDLIRATTRANQGPVGTCCGVAKVARTRVPAAFVHVSKVQCKLFSAGQQQACVQASTKFTGPTSGSTRTYQYSSTSAVTHVRC